jgi:hypothetical protein
MRIGSFRNMGQQRGVSMSEAKGWRLTRRTAGPQVASGLLLIAAALAGCRAGPPRDAPVSLSSGADGPDTRLTLQPAPDFRISVRPAPALELAGGTVVRFTGTALTTDSAYFAEPPTALLPGRHSRVHGTLRASVCQENEQICRSVKLEL